MSVRGFARRARRTTPSMPRSIRSGRSGMLEASLTAASTNSRSTGPRESTSRSKRNACGTEPSDPMPAPTKSNLVSGNRRCRSAITRSRQPDIAVMEPPRKATLPDLARVKASNELPNPPRSSK